MTLISTSNNTALLLLKSANAPASPSDGRNGKTAADKITAIVHGITPQASSVKTQASSMINSTLLDMKETNDGIVSSALDFLDSDSFKASDSNVKEILKRLINDDGAKFASLVKAEKAKNSQISDENAMANAIQSLIKNNTSKFDDGEFVIGFKLSDGGAIISSIDDVNGNSTRRALRDDHSANVKEMADARDAFLAAGEDQSKLTNSEGARLNASTSAALSSMDANSAWINKWKDAFVF